MGRAAGSNKNCPGCQRKNILSYSRKNSRAWLRRGKEEIQALHTQLRYFHGDLSALSYVIRSLGAIIMKIRKRCCNLCASTVN